jgi:NAD(P)-dependent dehydrogenase (short-subunit alcohol dehydrogenase family)
MSNLKDKMAAVFAASGDIAGAVARGFARHGAKVYVSGRDLKKVKALADEIRHEGGTAVAVKVDAMNESEIDQFLGEIVARDEKLDIVFNGIGLHGSEYGADTPATELSFGMFMRAFEVHCGSQFLTSRAAARYMVNSGTQGTILTLTSALSKGKFPNRSGLTTACTAIEGLTRAIAAEVGGHRIKVIGLNATALPDTTRIRESFVKYGKSRWSADAQDVARQYSLDTPAVKQACRTVHATSPAGAYEIKEHIDFCFICISKTLPVENQIALILKDIYDFSVQDICQILEKTEGVVKHLLIDARKTMMEIFDNRCALINKKGTCHQCSKLNGIYNPKQDQQEALMKLNLVKGSKKFEREKLYSLRTELVKAVDLMHGEGSDLTEILFRLTRKAIGEIEEI